MFKVAAQMVRADPELSALCRVIDSTKTIAVLRERQFLPGDLRWGRFETRL